MDQKKDKLFNDTPPSKLKDMLWIALFTSAAGTVILLNQALGINEFPTIKIGFATIGPFGATVAMGVLCWFYLIKRWCYYHGLNWNLMSEGMIWIAVTGFIFAHIVSIAFYSPQDLFNLKVLLDFRTNISSFGGFLGGTVATIVFLKKHKLPLLKYVDAIIYGFVAGFTFGRIGCSSVHDHPGKVTDFFLGIPMDTGISTVVRHDLGFYELLSLILLIVIMFLLTRKKRFDGFVAALLCTYYAPVRFMLDFLRVNDAHYFGLTPGQWFAIPLFSTGLWLWYKGLSGKNTEKPH